MQAFPQTTGTLLAAFSRFVEVASVQSCVTFNAVTLGVLVEPLPQPGLQHPRHERIADAPANDERRESAKNG